MKKHIDHINLKEPFRKEMTLNMGPAHPSMHGVIKIALTLEDERIKNSELEIGYLHRAFEKSAEVVTYNGVIPYTDRLNYVSPLLNNFGYALAVEKLLEIDTPRRTQFIRVIMGEFSRIADHFTCNAALCMELGGFTPYLYAIKAREYIYELIEMVTGARVTTNYARVGGLARDLPPNFKTYARDLIKKIEEILSDIEILATDNPVFLRRWVDISILSREDAIAWGITGPMGRASGFDYDIRRDHPYFVYDEFDFNIPVGTRGDIYDRYLVRTEEIKQSIAIIKQGLDMLPRGPININNPGIILPAKEIIYNTIEGMNSVFNLVINGVQVPRGEIYSFTEAGNGELGFYIVSDGSGKPYRVRVRPPCFLNTQLMPKLIQDHTLGDIIPIFGSINMIAGELDR